MFNKMSNIHDSSQEEEDKMNLSASSGSEGSPSCMKPYLEDLSLEKDSDKKTLKQEVYDLKLRIYLMEEREKVLKGNNVDEICQKYVDLQTEYEKLLTTMADKDELILKVRKVTTYLREEKDKLSYEFQQKEKYFKEHILELEKELDNVKLCNPKFGLHSTILMSGDTGDSFSLLASREQQKTNELERQIEQMNMDLDNYKMNNEQLEQTVTTLQRKINMCNKEISDLNDELATIRKERDTAIEMSSKNNDLLVASEKEKNVLESKLGQSEVTSEKIKVASTEQLLPLSDNAAAAVIKQLLTENKQINRQLRKLKDEQLFTYELCSGCLSCQKERNLKKASILNQRHRSVINTSEEDRSDTGSQQTTDSEPEPNYDNLCKFKENAEIRTLLKGKDKQIKQLRAECRKRNYNLQELVNKELWDKNREIEKLNKSCEKQKHEIEQLRKQADRGAPHPAMREIQPTQVRNYGKEGKENVMCLSDDVKMLQEQLRTCLDEKESLLNKIYDLEGRITSDEEQKALSALVRNLRLEVAKHRDEFEEADRARKDAFNACALLTNRLEELASFLESLLSHDNVTLNAKKRELLKQAIDRSREISKSFSNTFADPETASTMGTKFESSVDLSAPILPDYSEINLSFSCGDEDDDDIGNRTLKQADEENKNSVFNQMMRRSIDFASTEDSDSNALKKNIMFVKKLNTSGELIFSSEGVHQLTEDPPKDSVDSESEAWSEQDHRVRCGITSSGSKLRNRRWRPEPFYTTDSDTSARKGRQCVDIEEMRSMHRRILQLERFNESLREDLKYLRSRAEKRKPIQKTDLEKLIDKSKIRNLLNNINLENCVDSDKYQTYIEIIRNLESNLTEARNRILQLETKHESNNCNQLQESLDKASQRIIELESFISANDCTLQELEKCKVTVLKLTQENEKLLSDLDEVSKYRIQIEEYETQLSEYKKNCQKLELELFEKDAMEKLYKEQCAKLEEEIIEKNSLHNSLKITEKELKESRTKIAELECKINELNDVVREKENTISEYDCHLLELKNEKQSSTLRFQELKQKMEKEIAEKVKSIEELSSLLKSSNNKTTKFEHEIDALRDLLQTCEIEKRDFRAKMEKQVGEYQTLKKQHEQKMQHLLAQIIAYRAEEENSLAAHRQLIDQIEEAQQKKELWMKSISDWKDKYDLLKKEKDKIEEKLQCDGHEPGKPFTNGINSSNINVDKELTNCTVERDWFMREADLRYQLDVATMTTSHVILEWTRLANEKLRLQRELHQRDKPNYVKHLYSIKSQLETRVLELESVNKQLELRLQRLQTNKVFNGDFDLISEDSSRAASPTSKKNLQFDFDYQTYKSGTTTTGYSSSLPSSPNHVKCPTSSISSSAPSSPVLNQNENDCDILERWLDAENCAASTKPIEITPPRKDSSKNSATSPDLGIDSDHGRSSFDFELNSSKNKSSKVKTEIVKLEQENKSLKQELGQTRIELEETLEKLTALNKNKKRMEKAIFRQVYETKHILQRAREHLEDGVTETVNTS